MSCHQKNTSHKDTEKVSIEISKDTIQTNFYASTMWNSNTIIGEGMVLRNEKNEGSNQWNSIEIVNVFGFKKEVPIGNKIQIIPLAKELPVIGLKVVKTVEREGFEDDGSDKWYEIHPENVLNKEYWIFKGPETRRAEYPSDVLIVYPPVKNATLMDVSKIQSNQIPEEITTNIIKGALDFDNDGLPDAIVCEFCCADKSSSKDCEYTCGETYLKIDNKWVMIYESSPA